MLSDAPRIPVTGRVPPGAPTAGIPLTDVRTAGLPVSGLPPARVPVAGLPAFRMPPSPILPVAPVVAAAPAAGLYMAAGKLTADQLVHGQPGMFDHLQDRIVEMLEWVQSQLVERGYAEQIVEARGDPELRAEIETVIDRLILRRTSEKSVVRGADKAILIASVINEIIGLGPIEPLWSNPRITEVMVNGPKEVYAEIDGRLVFVPGARFRDAAHLLEVCQKILQPLGRRIDLSNPLEDGRLPDGSRTNVVHSAIAPQGPYLTIRRFPDTVWTLKDLVEINSLDREMATWLAFLIKHKCSAVVVGGTGSGKTSLLNALSSTIDRGERIATIEDALELRLHPSAHVLRLEARPPSAGGMAEVTIRDLVKNSLRMRPDRVIVGEVRDGAALDMLTAMNTGHEGSMTTVHANGANEAVRRLEVLVAQGAEGIGSAAVKWLISDAVDLFIVVRRYEDGSRRVSGIYEIPVLKSVSEELVPTPLWEWEQSGTEGRKLIGSYVKRNEVSAQLRERRRLDLFPMTTWEDVMRMSEVPAALRRKD